MPLARLESLCMDVVAANVHIYEPAALTLPYGGGLSLLERLTRSDRLRPETLAPVFNDWSSSEELKAKLGSTLTATASGCRGLGALAAQRLRYAAKTHDAVPDGSTLPAGTILVRSNDSRAARAAKGTAFTMR